MRLIFPALISLLSLSCVVVNAQPNFRLMENWDFPNDTRFYQRINKVIGTSNGYLVAVGEAVGKTHKDLDGLFLVINAEDGQVVYRKQFGDTSDEYFNSVVQNPDGTLTLVGVIGENSKSRQKGWLLQIDLEGQIYYEYRSDPRSKGGDAIKDVAITTEGIVMAVGHQNIGMSNDIWLLNIEKNRLTEYLIDNANWGSVEAIIAGANGSSMLLGNTGKENRKQPHDAWLLQVGADGKKSWSSPKFFGDKGYQFARSMTNTLDGGYAFAGVTNTKTAGKSDMWLVKTNGEGMQEWEKPIGEADVDEAEAIIELAEGGFALFGQTKSFLASLKTSMMKLVLTDKMGTPLIDDIYTLGGADEFGLSMTELYTGDIVIAGASMPLQQQDIPKIYMSAISYKPLTPPKVRGLKKEEHFGSGANTNLRVSAPVFVDPNGNKYLESGERAYVAFELTNTSNEFLNNVGGKISGPEANPGLEFWDNIKLGTLGPGQKKKLIIPVCAQSTLPDGQYQLKVDIDIDGTFAAAAQASVESNVPDPAKLIVSSHTFHPARHPQPGDPIQLRLALSNAGELPTGTVEAYFKLPAGVYSKDSEKVIIPSLRAGNRHQEVFTFFYDNTYLEKTINIGFETKGRPSDTFFKNFRLAVAGRNTSPPTAANSVQMIWLSHDTDDQGGSRSWDTNQRDVPIKIKALSKKKLDKGNFEIYANGNKEQGQKMDEEELTPPMNEAGGEYRQNYSNVVRLREGRNEIQVVYHNEDGTSYKSDKIVFNYVPTDKPSLYVFSIGVPYSNLKYTVKDSEDIANRFQQMADGKSAVFKKVVVRQFADDELTSLMSLRKIFAYLGNNRDKIKEHDLVIIFISSHGKVDKGGDFILIPSDYDPKVEAVTSLHFENDIINHLRYLDCKKLVFLDACHSGSAFYSAKSAEEEIASKVMHDLLINEPGLEIFASCDSYEYSYEDPSWENGAFTEAMLEALAGEMVPIDGQMISADHSTKKDDGSIVNGPDGALTIRELKDFLRKRVPYLVKTVKKGNPTPQNPANKSEERLDQDMRIFTVKKGLSN